MSIDMAKQRILARVPLESLVAERIPLTSRSGRKVGLCPFHNEKGPSFTIYDDHYFCFGCRARGDAIDYVRHQMGLGFLDALRYLAEKYGVEVPELEQNQADYRRQKEQSQQFRLLAAAQTFFAENLLSPRGETARNYLIGRGFSEENIKDFTFGLSPGEPQGLLLHLEKQGFSRQDMIAASLASPSRHGKVYDFFQDRLMIPIRDRHGRVIAFGGRTMVNDPAKYKNSRETDLFNKSHTLYGLDRAREPIRQAGYALVVEGYMDALQLWNQGFRNTVACLGTALTLDHLRMLAQMTHRVCLVFDGDEAGQKASLRTVSHALEVPQAELKVVSLPQNQDPDTVILAEGARAFQKRIDEARDLLDFAIEKEMSGAHALAIPDLINQRFTPWLQTIRDRMQRSFLIQRISQLSGIPAEEIHEALGTKKAPPPQKKPPEPRPEASRAGASSYQAKPLTPLQFEILGQLYFAQPNELDLDALTNSLIVPLEWDNLWQEWALEMVECLRQNVAPSSRDGAVWQVSGHDKLMEILKVFKEKAPAFVATDRMRLMTKLMQTIRRDAVRQSIKLLKSQLSGQALAGQGGDYRELLTMITQLNQELTQLESSLQA